MNYIHTILDYAKQFVAHCRIGVGKMDDAQQNLIYQVEEIEERIMETQARVEDILYSASSYNSDISIPNHTEEPLSIAFIPTELDGDFIASDDTQWSSQPELLHPIPEDWTTNSN